MVSKCFHVRTQTVGSSFPKITILRSIIKQGLTWEENFRALLEHNLLITSMVFFNYIITKGHITSHMGYKLFKTAEDQLIICVHGWKKYFKEHTELQQCYFHLRISHHSHICVVDDRQFWKVTDTGAWADLLLLLLLLSRLIIIII